MAIALSHGGPTIYSSPAPSKQVLVGTIEGVALIERDDHGSGWHVVHRTLTDKHIHAILIEPESGTVFVGAKDDSIYASSDGGRTWEPRDSGVTEHDIYSLECVRRAEGVRLYAGTEPAHLFYSDDLGLHWTELAALRDVDMSQWTFPAPPHIAHAKHITFHPRDPNTLFVGIEQGCLLKSTDAGNTFQVVPGMDDDLHRTLINPLNPDRIYAATGIGLYATSDGGATWEQWTDQDHELGGYPDMLVLHPRRPELMFIASSHQDPLAWYESHDSGSRVSKSKDGGRTWETVHNGLPDRLRPSFEAMCLEDSGKAFSVLAATATGEVWCSDDGGERWAEVISGLPPIAKGRHHKAFVTA